MDFFTTLLSKPKGLKQKVIFYLIIGLIISIPVSPKVFSQTDTSFWFGAPYNQDRTNLPVPLSWPVVLRFFTTNQPATVSISQPAGGGMITQNLIIPANAFQTLDLGPFINQIQVNPPDFVSNKGIKISSNVPISCYYEVISGGNSAGSYTLNSDVYPLKGQKSLGTEFYIPSQTSHFQDTVRYTQHVPSGFIIVGTKDNTHVEITPSQNAVGGHPANVPFNITLNKGETFLVAAQFYAGSAHLAGSHVISDKLVAINTIDEAEGSQPPHAFVEASDMGGDQIVPINHLGTEYVVYNFGLHSHDEPDEFYVIATEDNTVVSVNGTQLATLNKGQTFYQPMSIGASYVKASKPVLVWQISGVGEQTGQSLVPPVGCGTGTSSVSFIRSINGIDYSGTLQSKLKISLIVPNGAESDFQINGSTAALSNVSFVEVPGTNGRWLSGSVILNGSQFPVGSIVQVSNNQAKFILGYLEGGNFEGIITNYNASFAYFSDWDAGTNTTLGLNPEINPNPVCEGATVHFSVSAPSDPSWNSFHWEGPNGFSSDLPNPTIANASADDEGWYYVSIPSNFCVSGRDSIYLEVKANPTIMAYASPDLVCEGEDVQLIGAGSPDLTYNWSGPNGFSSGLQNPFLSNMATDMSGIYYLTADSINGCTSTVGVWVSVNEFPEFTLGNDTTICNGVKIMLQPDKGYPNGSYLWSTGAHDPNIIIQSGGTYSLTITRPPHCATTATIHVGTVDCDCHIFIPTAFTPNKDGMNDIWNPTENWGCVLTQYLLQVYNRWGQLVFTTHNPEQGWDGYYLGKRAELGVYFFNIRYTSFGSSVVGHEKGSVTLIR